MANIMNWLKDKKGNKFIPKTLTKAIQNEDGVTLETTLNEINSNLNGYDCYNVAFINTTNYNTVAALNEYRRNGITTVVFGALRCVSASNTWVHCATLKSKPLTDVYINLTPWEDSNNYRINCKIDTNGKIYFRYGVPTTSNGGAINYYGTITFS